MLRMRAYRLIEDGDGYVARGGACIGYGKDRGSCVRLFEEMLSGKAWQKVAERLLDFGPVYFVGDTYYALQFEEVKHVGPAEVEADDESEGFVPTVCA